jgi:hypothetical protein
MAIKSRTELPIEKRKIDLQGPEGNAFVLLGIARSYCKTLDLDFDKVSSEMTSGEYDNLITVFDNYFGDYVDLYK